MVGGSLLSLTGFVVDQMGRSPVLGWASLAVVAAGVGAVLWGAAREIGSYRRLTRVDGLRGKLNSPGAPVAVCVNGRRRLGRKAEGEQAGGSGPLRIVAPMPGKIVRVLVRTGEAVHARQPLIVIEAMKMENELRAAGSGTVAEIRVTDGQSVEAGALLAVIHRS